MSQHNPSTTYQELIEENALLKQKIHLLELSESKQAAAENALKASEEKYSNLSKMLRLMCDTVPDMIWAKDLERRFIFTNRAVCRDLLNARDTDEPVGRTDMFFATRERESRPDDPQWHTFGEICIDSDKVIMESRKPAQFDEFGNVKGKFLFLDVHKAPLFDENGKMIGTVGSGRDITEIKYAENALRESEQKYRLLANRMTDAVWISDLNFKTTYVSPSVEYVLGVPPEERMKIPFEEQVTPETYTRVMERLAIEMAKEGSAQGDPDRNVTIEMEYYHRNGSIVWMENIISAIRNADGQLTGLQGVARDITDRKRAGEALRESEELFRVAMERAPDGVYMNDLEGNFLYGNKKAEEIIGYDRDELIGRNFLDLNIIAGKSMGKAAELLKANIEGRSTGPDELEMVKKDGRHILIEITTNVIQRRGQTDVLAFVRDISDRKRTEEALRESEKKFKRLADNMYDMIVEVDLEGTRIYVSPSHKTVLGIEPSELLNRSAFDPVHPDDLQYSLEAFSKGITTASPGLISYRHLDSEGNYRWLESYGSPLFDNDHVLIGGVIVSRDITARKLAEEKLNNQMGFIETLLDTIPSPIFYKDTLGKYLGCNRAYEEIIGMSREEVIGKDIYGIYPNEIADFYAEKDREIYECPGRQIYDGKFKAADDTIKDVIISKATYTDIGKNVAGLVGVIIDITERKQTGEALLRSEEKYRELVENANSIILRWSRDGEITFMNEFGQVFFGYTEKEIIGRHVVGTIVPEMESTGRDLRPLMDKICANPKEFEQNINENMRRNGERVWISWTNKTVLDKHGQVLEVLSIGSDITDRRLAEEELHRTLAHLRKAFGTIIQVMVSAVETRDPYTAGHQNRSASLARSIAIEMELPQDKIDGISMVGSIHDIGKLSIPAEILAKPTKLSEIELPLVRQHAQKGYEMLKDVESPWPMAEIVYQHHERMDGSGYPRGLKGDEILKEARILAIADVVESMASHRPYRPALGLNAALEEIENNKGTLYDADAVDACLRLFRDKGFELEGE